MKRVIGWVAILAASAYFLIDAALPYATWSAETYRGFWTRAPWLLAHVVGGSAAILFGPWQFWTARRNPRRSSHRWTGRIYLGGVALAGASALYLGLHTAPRSFAAALFGLDAAWVGSTLIGYLAIRNGQVARHREWMIRSYALTLAFVTFRLWLVLALRLELGDPAVVVAAVGWLSWLVPLAVLELLLRRRRAAGAQAGVRR